MSPLVNVFVFMMVVVTIAGIVTFIIMLITEDIKINRYWTELIKKLFKKLGILILALLELFLLAVLTALCVFQLMQHNGSFF